MTTPNFDLLDAGTFGDKRGVAIEDVPDKIMALVRKMAETGQAFTVPTDDPEYKTAMRPYFAAAAESMGREARVWDVTEDEQLIGFRVSLGKGRRKSHKSSTTGDAPVGAE